MFDFVSRLISVSAGLQARGFREDELKDPLLEAGLEKGYV